MELTSPRIIPQPFMLMLSSLPPSVPDGVLHSSPCPDPTYSFLPMKLFLLALLEMTTPLEGIALAPLAVCPIACSSIQPNYSYILFSPLSVLRTPMYDPRCLVRL